MGSFECSSIINNKISLEQIGILLEKTINIKEIPNNEKPFSLKYNLYEEYNQLKRKSKNNTFFYYSKKCKCISSFIPFEQEKDTFIKWVKILYDFNNINEFKIGQTQKIFIDKYFQKNLEKNFFNHKKYFLKLVALGVPKNLRQFIWSIIIDKDERDISNISNSEKEEEYFQTLISISDNKDDIKQIEKDIYRTFPEKENTTEKIEILKQILIALVNLNEKIGYCQGINFIVALILKITNFNKIKAFHLSRLILKKIKGYFISDFPLLKYNLAKFDKAFIKLFPKLFYIFKDNDIINEMWIGKWIQTLFTITLPFNQVCYIWDALLVYGMDFIVPISLSILYFIQDKLISLDNYNDILVILKGILEPNEEDLINRQYQENINLKNYIITIREIISNAKKIRNQLDLAPHDGNEYGERNKLDLRESLNLKASIISNNNFEQKMEQIKSRKFHEKKNNYKFHEPNGNNEKFYNKNNDNTRINKFISVERKKNNNGRNMENNTNNIKKNCKSRKLSYEFNENFSNIFGINYANYKMKEKTKNPNISYLDNNNIIYKKSNICNNDINNLYQTKNNILCNSFNNFYQQLQNLNYIYGFNTKKINIFNNNQNNLYNNCFQNKFNNQKNMNYAYNNKNPMINININYNPAYYNIIMNNTPNENISRKNIRTPEINRIKLRERIINQMDNRRNNLNMNFFSNNINEFFEGEKYKHEIPRFNIVKIIN